MEMTIDEALNLLNNSKPKSNNAFSIQINEAINVISDTMRKYQKIEEIIKTSGIFAFDVPEIRKIAEVINHVDQT